jgi:hypothetical protein
MDRASWTRDGLVAGADHWVNGGEAQHRFKPERSKGGRVAGCRMCFSTYLLQSISIIGFVGTVCWIWLGQ